MAVDRGWIVEVKMMEALAEIEKLSCFLLIAEIGPDRFLPAPPHLAADRTGTDPSFSSSPRHRSDRNGPLLLLAENGPLQFLLLSAGPDPL
ncbi:Fructose-16-bisphosphatase chloroplastic [Dissostichus eleginoides]|uniref:Fructose-16-bisphosphatase chloroplastic n=1 Tax=Dissostichus eleginoides TaxID=100907 RepID=A0AAD9BYV4_DISEL|nr:Fructose-16-bisphosphatase chloroplastic [Dissostichus eleginoides]